MTYIIAEIGINHGGSKAKAKQMIKSAADCGADAVKFQLYDAERLEPPGQIREVLKQCQLNKGDMLELQQEARIAGVGMGVTPFHADYAEWLIDEEFDFIKLASGAYTDPDLISGCTGANNLIVSTGGMELWQVMRMTNHLSHLVDKMTILHCTSAYPAPYSDMNIRNIEMLRMATGRAVGLSDHGPKNSVAAVAAVCLGAQMIERHFMVGPESSVDESVSLVPADFRHYVDDIRAASLVLGSYTRLIEVSEHASLNTFKRRQKWRTEHGEKT